MVMRLVAYIGKSLDKEELKKLLSPVFLLSTIWKVYVFKLIDWLDAYNTLSQ